MAGKQMLSVLFAKDAAKLLCVVAMALLLAGTTGCSARRSTPIENPQAAQENILKGMEAYTQGDCKNSMLHFSEALRIKEHPTSYNGLGMAQLMCNQPRQAVESLRKAVSMAPSSASLHTNLGTAYFELGEYRKANSEFETALRYDPINPEALVGKAGIMLHQGKPEEAMAILRILEQDNAQKPEVLFNRGLILYEMRLYGDAANVFAEYLAIVPDDPEGYNSLGISQLGMGRTQEALENLNKAVELDNGEPSFYYNRGNVLKAMKKFPQAIDDYGRAISYNPGFAEAFVNRGDLLFLSGRTKEGCQDLSRACDLGLCERLESFQEIGRCQSGAWR